jgi:type I restriction enzyme, S subunit
VNTLTQLQRGTNYQAVRDVDILAQVIPLPPVAERNRIVSKISELLSEKMIVKESIEKVQPIVKELRQSILNAAFNGKLTEELPSDESVYKLLEKISRFREVTTSNNAKCRKSRYYFRDEIQDVPKRWIYTSLESVCHKVEGGATPLSSNTKNFDPNGIPLIKVENILKKR